MNDTATARSSTDKNPNPIRRIHAHIQARRRMIHSFQHLKTVGSSTASSQEILPAFGDDKPYPPMLPEQEDYVVEFEGSDDPIHAQNWPTKKK
jgi:DHA1 family multidrug resistance protein-like MFS transporter